MIYCHNEDCNYCCIETGWCILTHDVEWETTCPMKKEIEKNYQKYIVSKEGRNNTLNGVEKKMWIWKSDLQYWIRELEHNVEKYKKDSKEEVYLRGKLVALLRLQQKKSPI